MTKMKILFVNPPNTTSLHLAEPGKYIEENIGNQFFPFARIPFEIMATFQDAKDIEQDIILLYFEWYKNPKLTKEELIDLITEKSPDIILTTIIAQANADSIDWLTTKIKEKLPKCTIIIGGQAIRHFQEKIFKFCPNIDFALIGNANDNLKKLIGHLKTGSQNLRSIGGLVYRIKGKIKKNSTSFKKPNNPSPEILYGKYRDHILRMTEFIKSRGAHPLGIIEFSKGCPFNCNFCAAKSTFFEKETAKTFQEIGYLYNLG